MNMTNARVQPGEQEKISKNHQKNIEKWPKMAKNHQNFFEKSEKKLH